MFADIEEAFARMLCKKLLQTALRQFEQKSTVLSGLAKRIDSMRSSPFVTDISGDELNQMGITSFGYIKTSEIVFSEEVRHICEGNQCRNYGKTWACPPAVGTFEECRSKRTGDGSPKRTGDGSPS
ncbi:MAG: DUF2284 domain-containing protein [Acutalibacteraceae bacterium]